VRGSQPSTAEKPGVPPMRVSAVLPVVTQAENLHPGFVPLVMSFSISGYLYKVGFRNPSVLFPATRRSSLIRLI